MNKKEIVINELKAMGFELFELSGVGYYFNYDDINYLYIPDDDDEHFLRIVIPYLFDVTDENRMMVLDAISETNLLLKYTKTCIMYENTVWAIYEHYLNSTENMTELLEHIIRVLEATANVFHKKMNGEEVIGRSEESDDCSDEELEAELQKMIERIEDEEEFN